MSDARTVSFIFMPFSQLSEHTGFMAARNVAIPTLPSAPPMSAPLAVRRLRTRVASSENIEAFTLNQLRWKVRQNRVSFPSQVPTFPKHDRPDVQRKAVQLYFLFGWSCERIAQRHGLLRQRVQQILSTWKRRAIQMGYIQEIPPDIPRIKMGRPIQ